MSLPSLPAAGIRKAATGFFWTLLLERVWIVLALVNLLGAGELAAQNPTENETGRIRVTVYAGDSEEPTPVRARLLDVNGRAAALPPQAIGVMYGMWDHADGFAYQPDSSFYVNGFFEQEIPAGRYVLELSKGNEYIDMRDTVDVASGGHVQRAYRMRRWIDAASMGWYSSDGHIHIRRSPREDPLLMKWIQAEDVHVGNMLRMGDFWATYYQQYAFGEAGAYREGEFMIVAGQEDPRTPEIGHVVGLGASKPVRFRDRYYLYDLVLDSIRALGGVAGYAHQGATFHGYRGVTLDGLRDKVDLIELIQFCAPGGPLITDQYYFLLDLGFRATAVAGSDFPWCGKPHDGSDDIPFEPNARIGNARFYTYLPDGLSYASWIESVRMGRTFASSGPIVLLEVNGHLSGDTIDLDRGDELIVEVEALGHESEVPLQSLEIVAHGDVIAAAAAGDAGQSHERMRLELKLTPEHGLWLAARVRAGPMQVAHTTPVYVTIDGDGFHDPSDMDGLLERAEHYLDELEHELDHRSEHLEHQAWRHREGLMQRIEDTRAVIDRLQRER